MKYTDPFLGEIDLKKLGEVSNSASVIETIYIDERGNYYIETWTPDCYDKKPMFFLRKNLIDKINDFTNNYIGNIAHIDTTFNCKVCGMPFGA